MNPSSSTTSERQFAKEEVSPSSWLIRISSIFGCYSEEWGLDTNETAAREIDSGTMSYPTKGLVHCVIDKIAQFKTGLSVPVSSEHVETCQCLKLRQSNKETWMIEHRSRPRDSNSLIERSAMVHVHLADIANTIRDTDIESSLSTWRQRIAFHRRENGKCSLTT
jgi:hypothetical protein